MESSPEHEDSRHAEQLIRRRDCEELRAWLTANASRGIGQWDNPQSLEVIDALYSAGARRVSGVEFTANGNLESTDTLIVELGGDAAQRQAQFALIGDLLQQSGFDRHRDVGQRVCCVGLD